jgi:hypothetical protein
MLLIGFAVIEVWIYTVGAAVAAAVLILGGVVPAARETSVWSRVLVVLYAAVSAGALYLSAHWAAANFLHYVGPTHQVGFVLGVQVLVNVAMQILAAVFAVLTPVG